MRGLTIATVFSLLLVPQLFSSSSNPECKTCQLPQDEVTLLGNVSVRHAFNGNIVVIVDQFNQATGASDGIPDLVFRFTPKEREQYQDVPFDLYPSQPPVAEPRSLKREQYQNVSFDLQSAKVFFTTRRLAVTSSDGHVMVSLSLEEVRSGDPLFAVYGDRSTDLANTVRTSSGIGLLREVTKRAADGSFVAIDMEKVFVDRAPVVRKKGAPFYENLEEDPDDQGICNAGGIGSTSCSIQCGGGTGCSVGCSSGTYSCCTCPAQCRCRINP